MSHDRSLVARHLDYTTYPSGVITTSKGGKLAS